MRRLFSHVFCLLALGLPLVLSQYQQQSRYQQQPPYQPQQQQQQQYNGRQNVQQTYGYNGMQQQQNQMNNNQMYQQNGRMMNNQQQQQPPQAQKRTVVVNTPVKLAGSKTATSRADGTSVTNGAQIDIQLNSYTNADLSLSNVTTCSCPINGNCDYLSPTQQNACSFSFMTVISARDQSVQFIQSDFYPFGGQIAAGNWTLPHSFQMPSKPVAIDIFVQHMGVIIDKATASLLFFNHLTLVDTFVVDMTTVSSGQQQRPTLIGQQLNTQLSLTITIQCINGMKGEMCDLNCPDLSSSSGYAVCTDSEGRNASCKINNGFNNQVGQCTFCTQFGANGTCATVMTTSTIGVSSAYRTWTIVLGSLLGFAVLLILCLIIGYIIVRNKEAQDADRDNYRTTTTTTTNTYTNGKSREPLLDEWAAPPRRIQDDYDRHTEDNYSPRSATNANGSRQEHQV